VDGTEFAITFHLSGGDVRYRMRSASATDCDLWVDRVKEIVVFLKNLADLKAVDPAVAAAAATRLKSLLPALTIDALQLTALDANIFPASVQLLSSSASRVGDDCAACLGYLAACACQGLDASSTAKALAPIIQALEQAVARDSTRKFSFFRSIISVMGSDAGSVRAGLSKVVHGVLSSALDASLVHQLVAAYNVLPVVLRCLETADDAQCFLALLSATALILRAGQNEAATHGLNPYVVELCKLDALKVLNMPHLAGAPELQDVILNTTKFINANAYFFAYVTDFSSADPAVAAAAATRLKSLLPALTIDALQLTALDANIFPASVQLLSSSASRVGDDCAACLGYLAACACQGLDASSTAKALAPIIQALEQAVARDSTRKFSFFRSIISVMGSDAGSIRAGLSKVVHGVLSSALDASLVHQLVAAYNVLPVVLRCLETADDAQCFLALLSATALILRAGQNEAATHGRNPYVVELCKLDALKVLNMPHLTGAPDLKDLLFEIMQSLNAYLVQQVLSEAIPSSDDTTSFLDRLAESLEAVQAAHTRPADPPSSPDPRTSCRAACAATLLLSFAPLGSSRTASSASSACSCRPLSPTPCTSARCSCAACIQLCRGTLASSTSKSSSAKCGLEFAMSLSDDNKTSEVCMAELERCFDESASMAYMLFVRNKYGFRPPPRKVPRVDMDAMLALLPPADRDVIHEFYELDENEVVTPQECYRTSVNMHGAANVAAAAYVERNSNLHLTRQRIGPALPSSKLFCAGPRPCYGPPLSTNWPTTAASTPSASSFSA